MPHQKIMAMIERCNLMLEADKNAGAPWGDESIIGSFNEVIIGGAVALHFKAARSTIPSIVNLDQVEAIPFLAMLSLGGEYDGAMWWVRVDAITACRSADADQFNKYKLMKMSWARVDKEKLHTVLFAPRFPGTVGAAADWDALKAHAVELHNAGRAPGLIACGARAAWLNEPVMLYPTLAAIRGANYLTLMNDKEIRSVVTEMEIDAKELEAANDDDEPEDDDADEELGEVLEGPVVPEAELGDGIPALRTHARPPPPRPPSPRRRAGSPEPKACPEYGGPPNPPTLESPKQGGPPHRRCCARCRCALASAALAE